MIRLHFCAACGCDNPHQLHQHHLIPKSLGGTDDESNKITLCIECHNKIHGIDLSHKALTKAGQKRARKCGRKPGRKGIVLEFDGCKRTIAEWSNDMNVAYSTLQKRFARGWSAEKLLTEPLRSYGKQLIL